MRPDPRADLVARLSALQPPTVSPAEVRAFAGREFRAATEDDRVAAVVSGAGELLRLEVSALASRGESRDRLASDVLTVVNAALEQADAGRRELLPGGGDVRERLDELTERFGSRMDELLGRLDRIGRQLPPPTG